MKLLILLFSLLIAIPILGNNDVRSGANDSLLIATIILKSEPTTGIIKMKLLVGKITQKIVVKFPLSKRHKFHGRKIRYLMFNDLKTGVKMNIVSPKLFEDIQNNKVGKRIYDDITYSEVIKS